MRHSRQASHCITASLGRGERLVGAARERQPGDGRVPEQIARNDVLAFLRAQLEVAEPGPTNVWINDRESEAVGPAAALENRDHAVVKCAPGAPSPPGRTRLNVSSDDLLDRLQMS